MVISLTEVKIVLVLGCYISNKDWYNTFINGLM